MVSQIASVKIDVLGVKRLDRALRVFSETNPPFLQAAFEELGPYARSEVARRAPGTMGSKTELVGLRGAKYLATTKIMIRVDHPGARAHEFGRQYFYTGFTRTKKSKGRMVASKGEMIRTGRRVRRSPGMAARPFVGIVAADRAVAAIAARMRAVLAEAIAREWDRLADGT